jgi:hypothetical protein
MEKRNGHPQSVVKPTIPRFVFSAEAPEETPCYLLTSGTTLQLVDWAGRAVRSNKTGSIPADTPPILERLGMEQAVLLDCIRHKPDRLYTAIGPVTRLRRMAQSMGLKFIQGVSISPKLCPQLS